MTQACRTERGMTLVELMIALLVGSFVVAGGYAVLAGSERALVANDHIAATQQSARLAMELLAQDIRMAGYGMTAPVGACNTAIVPLDNTPGGADTGPDRIRVVVPTTVSTLNAPVAGPFNALPLTATVADIAAAVTEGFAANAPISIGGVQTTQVAGAPAVNLGLTTTIASPVAFAAGTSVFWLRCITYEVIRPPAVGPGLLPRHDDVNNVCGGTAPCLVRGVTNATCNVANSPCVPIADGIDDIQFAYACDGCTGTGMPDGLVDDQNGTNTFDQGDFVTDNAWTLGFMVPASIRLVQINLMAREFQPSEKSENTGSRGSMSAPVTLSDHNPTADAGYYDAVTYGQFSRRILTRVVQTRNLGLGL